MKKALKNFLGFLILMGLVVGLQIAAIVILSLIFGLDANFTMTNERDVLVFLFATIGQLLASLIFVKFILKKNFSYIWLKREKLLENFSLGFFIGFLQISVFVILAMIFSYAQVKNINFNRIDLKFFMFLIGFTIQSTSEEFLVRGIFTGYLFEKMKASYAVLIPAFIFSLLHLFNGGYTFLSALNTFLVGIFYGILILACKNILLVSGAHSAWNFSMSLIYGLPVSGQVKIEGLIGIENLNVNAMGGIYGPEGSFLVTIIECLSILCAYLYIKKRGFYGKESSL